MGGKGVWREERYAICLSAVDRRVIISVDDVAHRTGKKTAWGMQCLLWLQGGGEKKDPKVLIYFLHSTLFSDLTITAFSMG